MKSNSDISEFNHCFCQFHFFQSLFLTQYQQRQSGKDIGSISWNWRFISCCDNLFKEGHILCRFLCDANDSNSLRNYLKLNVFTSTCNCSFDETLCTRPRILSFNYSLVHTWEHYFWLSGHLSYSIFYLAHSKNYQAPTAHLLFICSPLTPHLLPTLDNCIRNSRSV